MTWTSTLRLSLLLNDINGIVTVLADNSNALANLTYSRELETEADQRAMAIFQSEGLDLKGFVDLFTLLKSEHGEAVSLKLLSTHPLTGEGCGLQRKWRRRRGT